MSPRNRPAFGPALALFLFLIAGDGPAALSGDLEPGGIEWAPSFEQALEQAEAEKKFVMVDFFTHWCHWCKVLDQKTYSDPGVIELSRRLVNVKVNAGTYVDLAKKYGVTAYPTVLFLNPDGSVRKGMRGFRPPDQFIPLVTDVLSVKGQRFVLRNRIVDRPADRDLRREYSEVLGMDGDFLEAAAQVDTLLRLGVQDQEERASYELDRLIYRQRAGDDGVEPLRRWVQERRDHPRIQEARIHLARALERKGDPGAAEEVYRLVYESGTGWFRSEAGVRLQKTEPGPKGT